MVKSVCDFCGMPSAYRSITRSAIGYFVCEVCLEISGVRIQPILNSLSESLPEKTSLTQSEMEELVENFKQTE